jgi:hypothetical protein
MMPGSRPASTASDGFAIADVIVLAIATWFRWRHGDEWNEH